MTLVSSGRRAVALAAALFMLWFHVATASVRVPLSGWNWGNPTPQGNDLRAIDFLGGRGYAVGAAGTALRTDDGGATWSGLATGTAGDLDQAADHRPRDGGRARRRRLRAAPLRRRWHDVPQDLHRRRARLPRSRPPFSFVDRNVGYLLLADGSVLRTTDAGQSFAKQTAIPGTPAERDRRARRAGRHPLHRGRQRVAFVTPAAGATSLAYHHRRRCVLEAAGDARGGRRHPAVPLRRARRSTRSGRDAAGQHRRWCDVHKRPSVAADLTSIHCADATTCLITTDQRRAPSHDRRRTDGDDDHRLQRAAGRRRVREPDPRGRRRGRGPDRRLR